MKIIALMSAFTLTLGGSAFADESGDPYEAARRRIREDMQRAVEQGRADAEANRDPEMEKLLEYQRRGYGPEPHQVLRQMMDKLAESDSRWAEVPQDEKTLIGLCNVYRFYVSKADFERASKTARLIQKAYHHADRRFNMIVKATDHQDVISENIILLERYAGIEDVTELKLSRIENGSVLVDFESTRRKASYADFTFAKGDWSLRPWRYPWMSLKANSNWLRSN
ncbi:hypothetical protein [Sinorhizobium fredii]|uniref:hypothetical protein n=1 Tax=Rhizobium fredii TaxID=380 RepID=UPI0035136347